MNRRELIVASIATAAGAALPVKALAALPVPAAPSKAVPQCVRDIAETIAFEVHRDWGKRIDQLLLETTSGDIDIVSIWASAHCWIRDRMIRDDVIEYCPYDPLFMSNVPEWTVKSRRTETGVETIFRIELVDPDSSERFNYYIARIDHPRSDIMKI